MVSRLIHILIVTPVIFAWLRERAFSASSSRTLQAALGAHAIGLEVHALVVHTPTQPEGCGYVTERFDGESHAACLE